MAGVRIYACRACRPGRSGQMEADTSPSQPGRERRQVLLVEYQKAQDSAEHHDSLVWNITSLNWVGSAVLMGFVLNGIDAQLTTSHKVALLSIAGVGVLLSSLVWRWVRQLRRLK